MNMKWLIILSSPINQDSRGTFSTFLKMVYFSEFLIFNGKFELIIVFKAILAVRDNQIWLFFYFIFNSN